MAEVMAIPTSRGQEVGTSRTCNIGKSMSGTSRRWQKWCHQFPSHHFAMGNMNQNHLHLHFRKLAISWHPAKGVRVPQHSGPAKGFGVPYEERGLGRTYEEVAVRHMWPGPARHVMYQIPVNFCDVCFQYGLIEHCDFACSGVLAACVNAWTESSNLAYMIQVSNGFMINACKWTPFEDKSCSILLSQFWSDSNIWNKSDRQGIDKKEKLSIYSSWMFLFSMFPLDNSFSLSFQIRSPKILIPPQKKRGLVSRQDRGKEGERENVQFVASWVRVGGVERNGSDALPSVPLSKKGLPKIGGGVQQQQLVLIWFNFFGEMWHDFQRCPRSIVWPPTRNLAIAFSWMPNTNVIEKWMDSRTPGFSGNHLKQATFVWHLGWSGQSLSLNTGRPRPQMRKGVNILDRPSVRISPTFLGAENI